MAIVDAVDAAIFKGDSGANENVADITGLQTAASIVERTLTQANKIKGPETLAEFLALVDGKHAADMPDIRTVASVGANTLWGSTVANASAENQTVAQFLRASGLSWSVRGDIDTNTAADDFGAFVGRGRGIEGAGVAAVWSAGELIRDPYSKANAGEVALTINYLWGLAFPRPTNFARIKFVA